MRKVISALMGQVVPVLGSHVYSNFCLFSHALLAENAEMKDLRFASTAEGFISRHVDSVALLNLSDDVLGCCK